MEKEKLKIVLNEDTAKSLSKIAALRDIDLAEAFSKAIATQLYLAESVSQGNHFFVSLNNGNIQEVDFFYKSNED